MDRANIALSCRCVSVTDSYWVKSPDEAVDWKDVSLFSNSLNKIVSIIALKCKRFPVHLDLCSIKVPGHLKRLLFEIVEGKPVQVEEVYTHYETEDRRIKTISRPVDGVMQVVYVIEENAPFKD
jgi:hypothetical protein